MTWFIETLFGRLPIGWLQLKYNRTRFFAALAGVAFANILVLMQLGFQGALIGSVSLPYLQMDADAFLAASDMNTLADASPLPRQRMFQALAVPGVASATPLYYGRLEWKQPDGTIRTLDTFGIDPARTSFNNADIKAAQDILTLQDHALIDRRTRNVPKAVFEAIEQGKPFIFETKGVTLTVGRTFTLGGGITTDGYLIVSDQTFFRLFPQRSAGAPSLILLKLSKSADAPAVMKSLRDTLPLSDTAVRTRAEVIAKDTAYQTTQRPVGIVFGFGIVIGILVGIIIVYQVLSSDVADHLREYATMKAIGYRQRFFASVVFEEAMVLAVLGFIPGVIASAVLYRVVAAFTGLPMSLTFGRGIFVLIGTLVMCTLSGLIATRKLAKANPADLF